MRCSRRSVPLRGRELVERDLQWGSCSWPSGPGGLAQLHAIAKESVAYIYYPEHSHRRTHCAGIQQREAPTAGRAPLDEHQFEVEGAERPYVRPRSYWEAQRISQHLVI